MKKIAMRDLFFRTDNAWLAQDCRERLKTVATAALFLGAVITGFVMLLVGLFG